MRDPMRTISPWRFMFGMLAALLITTLALGQAAEAFTCNGESVSVEAGVMADPVANPDNHDGTSKSGMPDVCQHGHCHQSLRVAEFVALPEAGMMTSPAVVPTLEAALADGRVYTIEYPPRA
jgi:hypothetical protein